jgi:hypothetical protein
MKSQYWSVLVLALITLGLSACRTIVDTRLNPDGSGELRTVAVYNAQERENFEVSPENEGKEICDNLRENLPPDATLAEERHEDETHCVTTRSFSNLDELRQLYGQVGNVKVNQLKFDLGRLVIDLDVDRADQNPDEAVDDEWRITLPGTLGEHNATSLEGQTLVWSAPPGQVTHLRAESDVGLSLASLGGTGLIILVSLLGLLVLIASGLAVWLSARRSRSA